MRSASREVPLDPYTLPNKGYDIALWTTDAGKIRSTGIRFADASLAHLADREGVRTVFTTDRRDFSIIRLKRNRSLKLIPDIR